MCSILSTSCRLFFSILYQVMRFLVRSWVGGWLFTPFRLIWMDGNEDWNVGNVRKTLFKMLVVSYILRERGSVHPLWRPMIYIYSILFITRSSSHEAVPKVAAICICITCPTIRDEAVISLSLFCFSFLVLLFLTEQFWWFISFDLYRAHKNRSLWNSVQGPGYGQRGSNGGA